jgi:hypothetical protein
VTATETQQAAWQRQAAHTLTLILREHPHLPVIAWTIASAGATLTARVTTPGHSEQVFTAWATALDLTEGRTRHPNGAYIRLWAQGHIDGTRINLSTTTTTTSNDH